MKSGDMQRLKDSNAILERMEAEGTKALDIPLSVKYNIEASFRFGGKKRKASNSGGCGRAGRRNKKKGR